MSIALRTSITSNDGRTMTQRRSCVIHKSCLGLGLIILWLLSTVWSNQFHLTFFLQGIQEIPLLAIPKSLPNDNATAPIYPLDFSKTPFPSLEERLRVYLGDWYIPNHSQPTNVWKFSFPPRNNSDQIRIRSPSTTFILSNNPVMDQPFAVSNARKMFQCANQSTFPPRPYCDDVLHQVFPAMYRAKMNGQDAPLLMQFGDAWLPPRFPVFHKFRQAYTQHGASQDNEELVSSAVDKTLHTNSSDNPSPLLHKSPIIWKLNAERHFARLSQVPKLVTLSWDEKKSQAIFRGALTGTHAVDPHASPFDQCHQSLRCQFVYHHWNNSLINARLTGKRVAHPVVNGRTLHTLQRSKLRELLQYKALIVLEGNDVASALKWCLMSHSSVVLMPYPPTRTSWVMEELLVPWIHFVPLQQDASDAESRMQWVLDHPNESQAIAQASTEWMQILMQEDSKGVIFVELLQRYRRWFVRESDDESTNR